MSKIYFLEMAESINQIINTINIYTCTMGPGVVLGICLVLFIDHMFRTWNVLQPWSIALRRTVIHVDTMMDLLCLTFPMAYLFFAFRIPMTIYVVNLKFGIIKSLEFIRVYCFSELESETKTQIVNSSATPIKQVG